MHALHIDDIEVTYWAQPNAVSMNAFWCKWVAFYSYLAMMLWTPTLAVWSHEF